MRRFLQGYDLRIKMKLCEGNLYKQQFFYADIVTLGFRLYRKHLRVLVEIVYHIVIRRQESLADVFLNPCWDDAWSNKTTNQVGRSYEQLSKIELYEA